MQKTERKDSRLVARTTSQVQEMIQRAADYSGASLSQFLIESAVSHAREVIDKTENLHLSMAGADELYRLLETPPKVKQKLVQAAERYKDRIDPGDY